MKPPIFFLSAAVLSLGLAVFAAVSLSNWISDSMSEWFTGGAKPLQAPEFDDVSAFGDGDIASVDAWLREQVELAQLPSLSVAVVRDGEIVYQGAFGYENLGRRKEVTLETSYHVASVTKAFTASLAGVLHERGVIDLDLPVLTYLPEDVTLSTQPELGATITLRQLASHTSGLPRGVPGRVQSVEGRYELEPERLYAHLAEVTLDYEPGTDGGYSNLGYGLLGHALERVANQPFDQLLKDLVCDPLHLERTAIQENDSLSVAIGYSGRTPRIPETHSYRERLAGSGGLITSVRDLAAFLSAHTKPGFFSPEILEQLHTPARLADGSTTHRALGWSADTTRPGGLILSKNGGRNNCDAWIGFAPEHRVGVAVITNCGDPSVDDLGFWLLERCLPGGQQLVTPQGYAKVAPYTGVRWENDDDDSPIVQVDDQWSPLVSIDGIPIDRIMTFARTEFGDRARRRLAEDLVELLSTMGHEPDWTVTLGLETPDGEVELVPVRMNEHNRIQVREQAD